jgi:hypothetical protein
VIRSLKSEKPFGQMIKMPFGMYKVTPFISARLYEATGSLTIVPITSTNCKALRSVDCEQPG